MYCQCIALEIIGKKHDNFIITCYKANGGLSRWGDSLKYRGTMKTATTEQISCYRGSAESPAKCRRDKEKHAILKPGLAHVNGQALSS